MNPLPSITLKQNILYILYKLYISWSGNYTTGCRESPCYETTQLLESIIIKGALPANPARLGEKCWLMEGFWESQNVIGKIQASIQAEANSSQ